MRICTVRCPHCRGTIKINDVFRGNSKFKYKKCEICGKHVTKKQLFDRVNQGLHYAKNRTSREKLKISTEQAHKNWNEKYGDLLGGEYVV